MEIKKERTIDVSPTVVWNVLTTPEHIEKWLGVKTESNWKPNSDILFKFSWDGQEFVDKGKIIKLNATTEFAYSYWSNFSGLPDKPENYSLISFELEDENNQTHLKLHHSKISNRAMYESSDKNWEETLDQIKTIAELLKQ